MASSCLYIICIIHVVFWIYPTQGNTGQDELLPTGIGLSSYDSHHVVAQKNGKLLLNCSVDVKSTEYGVPLVSWRKDGQWISLDNRIQKVQNGSLYFKRVWHKKKKGVSDEGVYECVVKNSIGSIIARRVIVQVASIAKDYTSEPVSQEVVEGGVARFECKIRAVPPPLYTWIKDEIQLATSDRYIMMNSGILQILDVRAEDEGHYSCHATSGGLHHLPDTVNSITWKRSTEAYLTVTSGNKPRPASIVAGPSDTDALIGQTVILECLVDGFPKPTVRWRKENGNITRYVLQESNLKLLEVEQKDTGIYVCEVTSRDGPVITAKVRLTVITPPVITEKPKSVEWPRARLTRFLCNAEGFPKPVITWYKNGVDVTLISKKDGRYKVKENGQLLIEQSVKDDSGYYQCIAENSVDFTSAFARLAITTKDTAPGKPNVTARALTSNSIEVRWVSPEFDKRCPIIAYSMKVNERKSGINVDNAVVSATDVSKKFVNLKPFTNYTVYVTGFTTQCGAGEQSDPVTVATLEDVPSKAPLIRLVSTTPNTIMVAWDPLPAEVRNGIIIEYLVFYMKADTTIVMKHTTPGDATSFLIEGLQRRIRHASPFAVYINCRNHRLALCLTHLIKRFQLLQDVDSTLLSLWKLYEFSPQKMAVFKHVQTVYGKTEMAIVRAATTRWLSHMHASARFVSRYVCILDSLDTIYKEKREPEVYGIRSAVTNKKVVATILLLTDILKPIDMLSLYLQEEHINFTSLPERVQRTIDTLTSLVEVYKENLDDLENTETEFSKCKSLFEEITDRTELGRRLRMDQEIETPKEYLEMTGIPLIYDLIQEIQDAFVIGEPVLTGFSFLNPVSLPDTVAELADYGQEKWTYHCNFSMGRVQKG